MIKEQKDVSRITCHMSLVTWQLSPTATATDHPPANSLPLRSRLVHQNRIQNRKIFQTKNQSKLKKKKKVLIMLFQQYVLRPEPFSPCGSGPWQRRQQTDRQTDIAAYRMNRHGGRLSENPKKSFLVSLRAWAADLEKDNFFTRPKFHPKYIYPPKKRVYLTQ